MNEMNRGVRRTFSGDPRVDLSDGMIMELTWQMLCWLHQLESAIVYSFLTQQ